jgi:hypothetical protein
MGADSAGVNVDSFSLVPRADMKVFVKGPFVMGFTTSFRMGQLLHWKFEVPPRVEGVSDEEYMTTSFVDAVRQCLKDGGFAEKENDAERGGTFLVGYRGAIWQVEGDYQVGRSLADFAAVGSGLELCLGSLDASGRLSGPPCQCTLEPTTRIKMALEAAERFGAAVRQPFHILREP